MEGCGLGWSDAGRGQVAGCCEHGNEASFSIKCGEFLDELRNYELVQTDSASYGVSLLLC
jgi:hypothetical protein